MDAALPSGERKFSKKKNKIKILKDQHVTKKIKMISKIITQKENDRKIKFEYKNLISKFVSHKVKYIFFK